MNLIGHVAVALDPENGTAPSIEFLLGCALPDLAAIARVRIARPEGELGRGVEFHHACDAAFHESEWFRTFNCALRDALLAAGVARGAARACSHAGVEMLLDGELVTAAPVDTHVRAMLGAVKSRVHELEDLVPRTTRERWVERLLLIATTLDPARYREAPFVAERLRRMTAGRDRIELPAREVDVVAATLGAFRAPIADTATAVVTHVRGAVPNLRHRG